MKFPNWLIWVTNVKLGSLIVYAGYVGVDMQSRCMYAYNGTIPVGLLLVLAAIAEYINRLR